MLNNQQIADFRENGVLIIKNFFHADELAAWDKEIAEFYSSPTTKEEWQHALKTTKRSTSNFRFTRNPSPGEHPRMKILYTCLDSTLNWEGENQLIVRRPEPDAEWIGARAPHLDFPVYDRIRTMANFVFYVGDVYTNGGPFMYWPGSHITAWEYFREHPQDYMAAGDISQDQVFSRIRKRLPSDAIQFTAAAGDLMIWHSLILHSASVNQSAQPRKAVFGRWGAKLQPGEAHFDFNKDIWTNWNLPSW